MVFIMPLHNSMAFQKHKKKPKNLQAQFNKGLEVLSLIFGLFRHYNGVPGGIRTPDNSLRRRVLYPTELLGRVINTIAWCLPVSQVKFLKVEKYAKLFYYVTSWYNRSQDYRADSYAMQELHEGGDTNMTPEDSPESKDNVYLFPSMLDQYQIQLTRMLEAEQYREAKELLRFLLQCQGQEKRHYEEWDSLLSWLEMAFPDGESKPPEDEDAEDESAIREQLLKPPHQDEAYINQVMYIMQHHPMMDQQMLALERAVYIEGENVTNTIKDWLQRDNVHPLLQFKALQCLRKRGATGSITLSRLDERVELVIEETPLTIEQFPEQITLIQERAESVAEVDDPTLPHFARELWKESLQYLYGTTAYSWMLDESEETVDCFAAALHLTLNLTVYGTANDDDIRDTYGITDSMRFRYEQACRSLRSVAMLLQSGGGES